MVKRLWDVFVGALVIVLSLVFQFLIYALLLIPYFGILSLCGLKAEGVLDSRIFMLVLAVLVNGISCFEYFRRRRANVSLGSDASIIFLFPRGLDRIICGRERIQRGMEASASPDTDNPVPDK